MWDFEMGRVLGLMAKTLPFIIFRLIIYVVITLAYVLVTGGGAGIGYLLGKIGGDAGTGAGYGGLIGVGLVSAALYLGREYLLYMVKAGHIAVLVEALEGKELPAGRAQVEYAQAAIKKRFTESSVLFGVDQLIKGILRAFNRVFFTIATLLPIPGLQGLVKFINAVVNMSLTYLDEVILAYYIRSGSENPWESAQRAIVLYAQNYKDILRNALFLAIFMWFLTIAVFLVILGPVAAMIAVFPQIAGFWTLLFAALLAYGVKAAVIEPIAMTALMQVFFKLTQGQEPNPEWEQKLDGVSAKFRELKDKAMAYTAPASRSTTS